MIETDHIILRKASFADCDLFAEWESRETVIEHFCTTGKRNLDTITDEFHNVIHDTSREWMTIVEKSSKNPLGKIDITNIDPINDSLNIAIIYLADEAARGKGYGTESMEALLRHAFEELGTHRVTVSHFPDDKVASNLYTKLGFRTEGILKLAGKRSNEYFDMELRAILVEEWDEQNEMKALKA